MFAVRLIITRPNNTVKFFPQNAQMNSIFDQIRSKKLLLAGYVGGAYEKISENVVIKHEFWSTAAAAAEFYYSAENALLISSLSYRFENYANTYGVTYERTELTDVMPTVEQEAAVTKYRTMLSSDVTDDLETIPPITP